MTGNLAVPPIHDASRGFEGIPKHTRVVIIEDDQTTVELAQEQLASVGVRDFILCLDARRAMEVIESSHPDVVLLDLMMPGVSGLEILRDIRSRAELLHLPVIILTAKNDTATKITALEMGASDFLSKPIDFVELAPRIRNAVVSKFYRDALEHQAAGLQQRVEQQTAEIRKSYASLQRANRVLRQSCEAAESAAQTKSDFLARMSHEMRTPLTAIIGFAEEWLDQSSPAEHTASAAMAQTILRNSKHLLQLVNDLLDMAKIERGHLAVERVPCSPSRVLDEVVNMLGRQADEKQITLKVAPSDRVPHNVKTDPSRLQQILTNLIGNAIKFTDAGHVSIAVDLVTDDAQPKLSYHIADTGPGIPPALLNDIFMPFIQVGNAQSDKQGAGLGLTIAKYLVEELGGTISANSLPGQGSVFHFTIATGPIDVDAVVESDTASVDAEGPAFLPYRILLAEDAKDTQRLMQRILGRCGAETVIVDDGQAAWEQIAMASAEQRPFDLILTDVQMPRLNGYELTQRLRESGYTGRIIALTANAMSGEREKCLASGCDDYLTKPIERSRLTAAIERNMGLAKRTADKPAERLTFNAWPGAIGKEDG